jgi:hypothetical protein
MSDQTLRAELCLDWLGPFYSPFYSFRSLFLPLQLADCALGQLDAAAEVVPIEDLFHVVEAVPGERRDLGDACAGNGEARQGRAAQIVKCGPDDASGRGVSPTTCGSRRRSTAGPRLFVSMIGL